MTDYREFATLLIIAFLLSGCGSKSSFATSSELPNERLMTSTSSEQTGHRILVAATLTLSSRTGEIIIQPYRDLAAHWDVTSYLEPPQCDDCIAIEVEYHDLEMKIIGLNVTLRNPTTYKALDVRAILMPDNGSFEPGVHFLNADAYTELWDDGGQAKRNPFFAFGKNSPLRAFPPGYSEKNLFRISYNSFQDLINLPFVVDASWPGNCSEPFDLEPLSTGTIIADGSTKAHIAVILNGDKVSLDLSPLGGDPEWPLTLNPDWCGPYGQLFEGAATVPSGVAAGTYNIWVKGNTSGSKICLWSLMTLHISPGGYPTNPVPVCIFNIGTASS
jgi:hypothetical protein